MKLLSHNPIKSLAKLASFALLVVLGAGASATAQTARIQTSSLDHLAAKASETVDVNIDESLMRLTSKVFNSKEPDEARVKELVAGLKGIYVKM